MNLTTSFLALALLGMDDPKSTPDLPRKGSSGNERRGRFANGPRDHCRRSHPSALPRFEAILAGRRPRQPAVQDLDRRRQGLSLPPGRRSQQAARIDGDQHDHRSRWRRHEPREVDDRRHTTAAADRLRSGLARALGQSV